MHHIRCLAYCKWQHYSHTKHPFNSKPMHICLTTACKNNQLFQALWQLTTKKQLPKTLIYSHWILHNPHLQQIREFFHPIQGWKPSTILDTSRPRPWPYLGSQPWPWSTCYSLLWMCDCANSTVCYVTSDVSTFLVCSAQKLVIIGEKKSTNILPQLAHFCNSSLMHNGEWNTTWVYFEIVSSAGRQSQQLIWFLSQYKACSSRSCYKNIYTSVFLYKLPHCPIPANL